MNFADIEPQRRAECAIDAITISEIDHGRQHRRPSVVTAREALVCLQFEAFFVCVAAQNIANGISLSAEDLQRLALAARRIETIASEVTG